MNTTSADLAKLTTLAAALQAKFPMTECTVLRSEGKIFKKNRSDGTFETLDLEAAEIRVRYFNTGEAHRLAASRW